MNEELLLSHFFKIFRVLTGQMIQNIKEQNIELAAMHIRTLKIIKNNENCTTQIIADILNRDKAQVTRLINELRKQKLVINEVNPNDKRSQFLSLTGKGSNVLNQLKPSEDQMVKSMIRGINKKKLKEFTEVIQLMTENLKS